MYKLEKKPSVLKRGHPTLQNMTFTNYCLLLWVIFALLDPDPDSEYGSGSGFRIRIRIRIHRHRPDWGIQYGSGSTTLAFNSGKQKKWDFESFRLLLSKVCLFFIKHLLSRAYKSLCVVLSAYRYRNLILTTKNFRQSHVKSNEEECS